MLIRVPFVLSFFCLHFKIELQLLKPNSTKCGLFHPNNVSFICYMLRVVEEQIANYDTQQMIDSTLEVFAAASGEKEQI